MQHRADAAQSPAEERSTGELVKQLSEQVSTLVRDELRLAQLEMTRKGKQAGVGAGLLGGGGLIALYAVGCLIACVIIAISGAVAAWLAALIVGVVLLIIAGVAAMMGKGRLKKATPPVPREAVGSIKADVEARARQTAAGVAGRVKGQAGRVKGQVSQVGQDAAVGADIWRKQLSAKTTGTGRTAASWGGTAREQLRSRASTAGTSVRQAAPERVKQAAAQGAGQARQHPGPLAAGAAAIVVGYLAFRALRRR